MIAIGPAGFMAGPKVQTPEFDEEAIGKVHLTAGEAELLVLMAVSPENKVCQGEAKISTRVANRLVAKGFATYDKKAGSWTITSAGEIRCKTIY